jgi:hypothetical protein
MGRILWNNKRTYILVDQKRSDFHDRIEGGINKLDRHRQYFRLG